MKALYIVLAAVLLTAGAATAQSETPLGHEMASGENSAFITKEWTWSNGTVNTTFTAYGPAGQVTQLDPQNDPLACQDCELASSVHFESGDEYQPVSDGSCLDATVGPAEVLGGLMRECGGAIEGGASQR